MAAFVHAEVLFLKSGVLVMQGYIRDCVDVGHTNGPRSSLFSIFTATFLVMGLSFILVPELTKTGMFGAQPRLAAEDGLMWQMIGAAIATVVSPVACTQQVRPESPGAALPASVPWDFNVQHDQHWPPGTFGPSFGAWLKARFETCGMVSCEIAELSSSSWFLTSN